MNLMPSYKTKPKRSVNFISLRTRVFIIFSLLTLFFLAVDYGIQKNVIFPTYLDLEESEAIQNLERASEAIHREITHIDILCHDWASWDDTYEYAATKSQKFEKSNLTSNSFISNKINFIYICDSAGTALMWAVYDLVSGNEIKMNNLLDDPDLKKKLVNFSHDSFPDNISEPDKLAASGILNTEHGLLMIASRPILTSDNKGPARGALMMGRFLDNNFVERLTLQTKVDFNIISLYEKTNIDRYDRIISKLLLNSNSNLDNGHTLTGTTNNESPVITDDSNDLHVKPTDAPPYYIEKNNSDALTVYSHILDLNNKPAMIVSFSFPREISKQGMKTINFAIIYILIVGAVVLVLFLWFTNFMILRPLSRLTSLIKYVENTGDLSVIAPVERKDEIGILAAGFNSMMKKTDAQAKELEYAIKAQQKEIEKRRAAQEDLRLANIKLEELANIDPLTGIANRRHFSNLLEYEWKRAARDKTHLSIILCDIDFFKKYNDTYGHQQGDECLKAVACTIKSAIRRPPDLAARFGGEEFIAMLPNTGFEGVLCIAEKMRTDVYNLKITHTGSAVSEYVSISLGVASCIPTLTSRPEDLIEMADVALYRSKENGRNRVSRALMLPS
ncbi:MAG: diguanylate cyclase [Desulfamplus sp.]|nr:diguanylate cyclase [Desulfamplus sp.]